jgi:hypothetical protein
MELGGKAYKACRDGRRNALRLTFADENQSRPPITPTLYLTWCVKQNKKSPAMKLASLVALALAAATARAADPFDCTAGTWGACCEAYDPGDKRCYRGKSVFRRITLSFPSVVWKGRSSLVIL